MEQRMIETSGPAFAQPFAQYDPDTQFWKTSESICLWGLPLSSLILPRWGSMFGGELFEHPTPEHHTSARDYSLLLPTPVVNDMGAGKTQDYWETWAPAQKSSTGAPAPHGRSLFQELLAASTGQRSMPGPTSLAANTRSQSEMDAATLPLSNG
jgi:hypothetical protein